MSDIGVDDLPVVEGPFKSVEDAAEQCKVLYQKCRTPVYTPSDWDHALAEKSAEEPEQRTVLEYIYGYQGRTNTSQNLFYTSQGHLLYYTAGVGVVMDKDISNTQTFFMGHNDDISSLALCPAAVEVEDGEYPARSLVATGQLSAVDNGPYICIWNAEPEDDKHAELARFELDKDARGITALAFSACGTFLAAIATDDEHTVYVYEWQKQELVFQASTKKGVPVEVFDIEWNTMGDFATFGKKHVKVWSRNEGGWKAMSLSFGKEEMCNVTSAQWLLPGEDDECPLVVGTQLGALYVFKGGQIVRSIAAHDLGPKLVVSGVADRHGVRGLRLCMEGAMLISGGADGVIKVWDLEAGGGMPEEGCLACDPVELKSPFGEGKSAPAIRSLDFSDSAGKVVVGTSHCDIKELHEMEVTNIIDGHSADTWALAWHPTDPNLMATAADSGHIHVWDAEERKLKLIFAVGFKPRALGFSLTPADDGTYFLAVGGSKGEVKILAVLEDGAALEEVKYFDHSKDSVTDVQFSPDNRYLAVATCDTRIDVYDCENDFKGLARCTGHSATVRGVDWSADSSTIMSNSADLELLFWGPDGKQVFGSQRDTAWATYTCLLGFPVMGIWPSGCDGTDVNSLDRSKDGTMLATADDFGCVKLFNYPCVMENAACRTYRGHSSHVMAIRFNADDTKIASVGGKDWAIMQRAVVAE